MNAPDRSAQPVNVLAVMDAALSMCGGQTDELGAQVAEARAAVAELVAADREVDAIEDEMHRAYLAGPRPNSYGTGWEARDEAARKDRERRHEAAHARRRAALARVQGGAP